MKSHLLITQSIYISPGSSLVVATIGRSSRSLSVWVQWAQHHGISHVEEDLGPSLS